MPYPQRNKRPPRTRVNMLIRVPEVRLIDERGEQRGVVETRDALKRARATGLDLVEVSPTAKPPVCRIMDFGKFKYDQDKKTKAAKKNATAGKLKEIKFHANVDVHDYETKLRHAVKFLEAGHKVKFSLFFRGREGAHTELGFELMNRVAKDLKDLGNMEQAPKHVGRNLFMMVSPISKKN